jgi:hypothetical protein
MDRHLATERSMVGLIKGYITLYRASYGVQCGHPYRFQGRNYTEKSRASSIVAIKPVVWLREISCAFFVSLCDRFGRGLWSIVGAPQPMSLQGSRCLMGCMALFCKGLENPNPLRTKPPFEAPLIHLPPSPPYVCKEKEEEKRKARTRTSPNGMYGLISYPAV